MHILIACRSFPHHRAGGMEWHAQDVVDGLMEAGHTVSVLTTPLPEKPALQPLRVNGELILAGSAPGTYDSTYLWNSLTSVRRRIADLAPDIIHSQGFAGVILEKVRSRAIPHVVTIHGTLWSETPLRKHTGPGRRIGATLLLYNRFRQRILFSPIWKRFLRLPPPLVVDSDFTRRELEAEARVPIRSTVVPLGFDLARFPLKPRGELRKALGLESGDLLLVTAGRQEAIKRPDWVVESFLALVPTLPKLRLLIIGEGAALSPLLPRLEEHIKSGCVIIAGRLPADQLSDRIQTADLFLNADHGAPAFGLANAEALCMGTPVLTTRTGAHEEVVLEGDGALATLDIRDDWDEKLRHLLSTMPEGNAAREARVIRARARFAREKMIEGLVAVYQQVLKKH